MKQRNKSALQVKTGTSNKIHLYKNVATCGSFPLFAAPLSRAFQEKKAHYRPGTATIFFRGGVCVGGGGGGWGS